MASKISRRRLAREVVRMLQEQPGRHAEIVQQVAAYLIDTKRAKQAHLLMQDIADALFEADKHLVAEAHVAFPLVADAREAITQLLMQATGARTVELTEHLQLDLLGGVVLSTPRQELDASVRTQLKAIAGGMTQ